jgi:hypothetical protein
MIDDDPRTERPNVVNRSTVVEGEGDPRDRFGGDIGEAYM